MSTTRLMLGLQGWVKPASWGRVNAQSCPCVPPCQGPSSLAAPKFKWRSIGGEFGSFADRLELFLYP